MAEFSVAVNCYEEEGTAVESADLLGGVNCQVVLRCAYADRWTLMNDLLANARPWPKTTGLAPVASSCSARGVAVDAGTTAVSIYGYQHALVTVNYTTNVVDVASESLEPVTEPIPCDPARFRWVSGTGEYSVPVLDGEAPIYIKRGLNLIRTRYRLAALPSAMLTCLEGVNSAAYVSTILGLTFPAETLMFQPGGASRTFNTLTTSGWTAGYKFAFNPYGWNTFWRAETQQFESVYIAGGSSRYIQHPLVDYSGLLS